MIHVFDLMGFRAQVWDENKDLLPGEEAWETIFEHAQEVGIQRIYLEKNFKTAARAAKRVLRRMKISAQVLEYHATQNKLNRIVQTLGPACNTGLVSFEPHVLRDTANFRQLAELRYTRLPKPNDRIDTLQGLISTFIELPNVVSAKRNARTVKQVGTSNRPPSFHGLPNRGSFAALHRR